jgi:hypothetical protein
MQAVSVKCPECNAILEVGEADLVATCTYCNTTSRIQRRSQIFQLPRPMAPARDQDPAAVARQVRNGGRALALAMLVVVLAVGAVVVAKAGSRVFGKKLSWDGAGAPLVGDLDKDGVEDLIGFARYVDGDTMTLAAYSGVDGHVLWETPRLGTYTEVYRQALVLAAPVIVRADMVANLYGYDAATGTQLWKQSAGEQVKRFCASATPGTIVLETADKRWLSLPLATGVMAPASPLAPEHGRDREGLPPCLAIAEAHEKVAGVILDKPDRIAVPGMRVDRILARGDGLRLAVGYRDPGTAVPMVAALDAADAVVWKSDIPSTDPLRAATHQADLVTLTDDLVAMVYEHQDGPPSTTVVERATGKRLWETRMKERSGQVLAGVTATRSYVAVSTWGLLYVYDATSGALKFTIGDY